MRFGCCLNMPAVGTDDPAGITLIPTVAAVGYEYLEPSLSLVMALSADDQQRFNEAVAKSGLRCEAFCGFFPPSMRLTGTAPDSPQRITDYVGAALERAAGLGAEVVVVGSGAARLAPDGFSKERALEQLTRCVADMAPLAQAQGITLAIEHLRRPECNLVNTVEQGFQMARAINHPAVKTVVDGYHFIIEQDDPESLLRNSDLICHAHFADPAHRFFPTGMEACYRPYVEALAKIGYAGRMSCECYCQADFRAEAAQTLAFFRDTF